MSKGFGFVGVSYRSFYCELKHRPQGDDGSNEIFLEEFIIQVPRLRDSAMEQQWCFAIAWGKLYSFEWQSKGINQCFIFTAKYGEILARLEKQEFADEPMQRIAAPSEEDWKEWEESVKRKFKKVYKTELTW